MSFTFGIAAVQELSQYQQISMDRGEMVIKAVDANWFFKSMLPAMLTLALVDVTAYVAVRIRSIVSSS
jgi:hypothetical protein